MFGTLIDYWYYTGDTTYNSVTTQALLFQRGEEDNYEPRNQTAALGNDDQSFWAFAAMTAAELKFPNPPPNQPQWLALAQAVFNSQAMVWDNQTCGGGLRWQIPPYNNGYNYKNSISNGCFFTLGARLGAYTTNTTYFEWAEKSWDWSETIGLISPAYQVFDGTDVLLNCSRMDQVQWTYNGGVYLLGAATMWNQTTGDAQAKWADRVTGLMRANMAFFKNGVMFEVACEENANPSAYCNVDQRSFKAYLSRWMAATTKVAPWTADTIMPLLATSAAAAAQQCSGGSDGVTCGLRWTRNVTWDGNYGVGEQMAALEVILSNLINTVQGPVGNKTGGTSQGDPSAGTGGGIALGKIPSDITMKDKVGAGVLTAVVLIIFLGGALVSSSFSVLLGDVTDNTNQSGLLWTRMTVQLFQHVFVMTPDLLFSNEENEMYEHLGYFFYTHPHFLPIYLHKSPAPLARLSVDLQRLHEDSSLQMGRVFGDHFCRSYAAGRVYRVAGRDESTALEGRDSK